MGQLLEIQELKASLKARCIFVFKEKTAYEVEYGLVGSGMCIRDRVWEFLVIWCEWRDCDSVPILAYEKEAILLATVSYTHPTLPTIHPV